MAINIQAKNDYSFLFSGLNNTRRSNTGFGLDTSWLSDYASIKSGSYGKLLKAYYNESSNERVSSLAKKENAKGTTSVLSGEDTKAYTAVQSATDALKESADALLEKGKDSVFAKDDAEALYKAVNTFVQDYNEVMESTAEVNNGSIESRISTMISNAKVYEKALNKIGITINNDQTLSINKESFMKADAEQVENLFNVTGGFGYSASASASMINYNADYALSKANTYTFDGNYSNTYNAGNLFNSYL